MMLKPIISERSLSDAANGVYTFAVEKKMKKTQIKKAIEELFSVHVEKITVSTIKGKKRVAGRKRMKVEEPDRKKARARLRKNEKIDVFEVTK